MIMDDDELFRRANDYAKSKGIGLTSKAKLGYGSDGTVWRSTRPSAVKALNLQRKYENELECYLRLRSDDVDTICGFNVPVLEGSDDSLWMIEMSIVTTPYVLNFGKVWIDEPPPYYFDEQRMANARADARNMFGKDWPDVEVVLYQLRTKYGIYYADPRPANINCGRDDDNDDWMQSPSVDLGEYQ